MIVVARDYRQLRARLYWRARYVRGAVGRQGIPRSWRLAGPGEADRDPGRYSCGQGIRHSLPSASAQSIQDFYDREASAEKYYNTVQFLAKNGDVVGLQRELGLKPSQQVDMVKVNAATANMVRLQGIKNALGESAQLVRKIDQNPGIAADEKRQLIDTIYGAMIRIAHAGNEGFAAIDAALKP